MQRAIDIGAGTRLAWFKNTALAMMIAATASATAIVAEPVVGKPSAALVAVLGVAVAGAGLGLIPALAAALVAFLLYNFFLAVPPLSFRFTTLRDLAPLGAFSLAAILTGILAGRLKDREQRARRASRRLGALLEASRALLVAITPEEVALAVRRSAPDDTLLVELLGNIDPGEVRIARHLPDAGTPGSTIAKRAPTIDQDFRLALIALVTMAQERAHLAARISNAELLARSEHFKSLLLSSVSHDLRTPMAAIIAAASSLHDFDGILAKDAKARLLQTIISEADRLDRFTANLLELSRLQSGAPLPTQAVDPAAVVDSAIAQLNLPPDRNVSGGIPADVYTVQANPQLFQVALTNILENAVVHAASGDIEIEALADHDSVQVVISDHGPGIPDGERARIFDRFYRLDAGRPGSGLGLAIARGFVEASSGSIVAVGRHDGQPGARIVVTLPKARDVDLHDE